MHMQPDNVRVRWQSTWKKRTSILYVVWNVDSQREMRQRQKKSCRDYAIWWVLWESIQLFICFHLCESASTIDHIWLVVRVSALKLWKKIRVYIPFDRKYREAHFAVTQPPCSQSWRENWCLQVSVDMVFFSPCPFNFQLSTDMLPTVWRGTFAANVNWCYYNCWKLYLKLSWKKWISIYTFHFNRNIVMACDFANAEEKWHFNADERVLKNKTTDFMCQGTY